MGQGGGVVCMGVGNFDGINGIGRTELTEFLWEGKRRFVLGQNGTGDDVRSQLSPSEGVNAFLFYSRRVWHKMQKAPDDAGTRDILAFSGSGKWK